MKAKIKLRIVYKSGTKVDVTVSNWSVTRDPATQDISGYEFTDLEPRAAYIGMQNIESIWRL